MSAVLLQGRISRWVHRRVLAAIKVQTAWRGRLARLQLHRLRFAALKLQRVMHGACARLAARVRRRSKKGRDQELIELVNKSQRKAHALLRRRRRVTALLVVFGAACIAPAAAFLFAAAAGATSLASANAWPLVAWTQPLLGAGTGETGPFNNPRPSAPKHLPSHAPHFPLSSDPRCVAVCLMSTLPSDARAAHLLIAGLVERGAVYQWGCSQLFGWLGIRRTCNVADEPSSDEGSKVWVRTRERAWLWPRPLSSRCALHRSCFSAAAAGQRRGSAAPRCPSGGDLLTRHKPLGCLGYQTALPGPEVRLPEFEAPHRPCYAATYVSVSPHRQVLRRHGMYWLGAGGLSALSGAASGEALARPPRGLRPRCRLPLHAACWRGCALTRTRTGGCTCR